MDKENIFAAFKEMIVQNMVLKEYILRLYEDGKRILKTKNKENNGK